MSYKIILAFLVVLFVSLLLMAFSTNIFFNDSITQMADKYTQEGVAQVNASIENQIEGIEVIMDIVGKDPNVIEFLNWEYYSSSSQNLATRSNIRNVLTNMVESSSTVKGVMLVSSSDFYISNELYHDTTTPITSETWYQDCVASGDIQIMRPATNRNQKYFSHTSEEFVSIVKPLYLPQSNVAAGVMLADIDISTFQRITEDISWDKTGFVVLLDEKNNVIYSPVNDVTPRIRPEWFNDDNHFFQKKLNGQEYEFVYLTSSVTNWKSVGVFSLQKALQQIVDFRYFVVAILIITSLLAIVFISLFSRTIVLPIQKLSGLMKKAADHDYNVRFNSLYHDEIGELGDSFNTMVDETKDLIELVRYEQRSKRMAELKILQEQIKPHFLYNTFDTIHWIAKGYGATEIIQITRSLTTFLRVGLSRGNELLPVKDEISHVISYLAIQQFRYSNKLTYAIHVDPECENFYVQRLILQPLVENAIYHGIKNRETPGKLLVDVRKSGDKLLLSVTDNGNGISPTRLEKVERELEGNTPSSNRSVYGLLNVNERIRISYGKQYGVHIRTEEGHYCRVEIYHPIVINREGDAPHE